MSCRPIPLIGVAILLLLDAQGCTHAPTPDLPACIPASATTAPVQSESQLTTLLLAKSKGEYYMGDHLGRSLTLTLLPAQSYSLTWHGCQGLYGASIGKWRIENSRLLLNPIEQSGHLAESPLTALHIRLLSDGSPALVPAEQMPLFLKEGVDDDTCFRPIDLIRWR